ADTSILVDERVQLVGAPRLATLGTHRDRADRACPRTPRASGALVGIGVRLKAARVYPVQIVLVDRLKLGAAACAAATYVGRLLAHVVGDMDQAMGAPDGENLERF